MWIDPINALVVVNDEPSLVGERLPIKVRSLLATDCLRVQDLSYDIYILSYISNFGMNLMYLIGTFLFT
jgi:hypothetical protein